MKIVVHIYQKITSIENLLIAWGEFVKNKKNKSDVRNFARHLFQNIFSLHNDLSNFSYRHASYEQFKVYDPKLRIIHKPVVRDRLLHHAIYRYLQPIFDKTFIFDSYSCRKNKGTHKAFRRLVFLTRKISQNYTMPCWALKCDIKKFFASVDHEILIKLLRNRIDDEKLMTLLENIICSYQADLGMGIPLGNLTSQLFANIYMDRLDKFVKHKLKTKHYFRYADDFILLGSDYSQLIGLLVKINRFLKENLKLKIHPDKIFLRKIQWGIDAVGYINLPYYNLPRPRTVKRMFKKIAIAKSISAGNLNASVQSYLGYLKHANAFNLSKTLKRMAGH